jgi:tetratricopeptide (TPR) repeat protein
VKTFVQGVESYKKDNYPEAIAAFLKIAESGVQNSHLFYNLGNAYLRNNDLGHAILWYERALNLAPHDPDLRFNYEYALSLLKDEKEEKVSPIFRILFFWKDLFSKQAIPWIAICLNIIFWSLFSVQVLRNKTGIRTVSYLILVLTLVFTMTAFYDYYVVRFIREGVVLRDEILVRSGLSPDSTELFALHAGTKVRIEKEMNGFVRIYFSNGKIGWIKKSEIGAI